MKCESLSGRLVVPMTHFSGFVVKNFLFLECQGFIGRKFRFSVRCEVTDISSTGT